MTAGPERRIEERALFDRYLEHRNPAAREEIVRRFMPMARQLARRYRAFEDLEDLEQVAAIGLVKAVDRFDPEREVAFSSYAFPTILGELKRHLRDRGWAVRVPRSVQELAARVDRLRGEMVKELGRAPTGDELAARAGTTVEQILEAAEAKTSRYALSLDQPARDVEAQGYEIAIEDRGFTAVEDAAMLDDLMQVLTERERLILRLRFREDQLQCQIAEAAGVSQMQVSRIIRSAVSRLQAAAGERPLAHQQS